MELLDNLGFCTYKMSLALEHRTIKGRGRANLSKERNVVEG